MSTELVISSNHLTLCHTLLLPPSIFTSIRVFSNESVLQSRWTKYWHFSFSISLSNEYSGLISFKMGWISFLSKGLSRVFSIHDYGKYHSFDETDLCQQKSLFFNMLSRLVIAFLPKSKHLLILWLKSPSAVILEPPKIKSATVSIVSPSTYHEVMGPDAMIFVF